MGDAEHSDDVQPISARMSRRRRRALWLNLEPTRPASHTLRRGLPLQSDPDRLDRALLVVHAVDRGVRRADHHAARAVVGDRASRSRAVLGASNASQMRSDGERMPASDGHTCR